jgi:nicotinamidase/pyrazinamidase
MPSPAQSLRPGDALLVVDVQADFLPGGALAVPAGDEVVPALNRSLALFRAAGLPVALTRDWHPADHCSFRARGGPWPPHCARGTAGAAFAPGLEVPAEAHVVSKATGRDEEAYSGFTGTDLHAWLQAQGARRLFVGGLATDYCVLATVRDALGLGYAVVLLLDCVRAVDVAPGDGERAVAEMFSLGAEPLYAG